MKLVIFFILFLVVPTALFIFIRNRDYSEVIKDFKASEYIDTTLNKTLQYRFFSPKKQEPNEKYPLVLYLHSAVPRGNDNISQLEIGARLFAKNSNKHYDKRAFILAPQCPKNIQWANINFDTIPFKNYNQDEIPESNEMKIIIKLIHELSNSYNIDINRLYVTGISMGGSGTWDIVTRYPHFFAAAVPLNGVSDTSVAHKIAHLPIWAFHGRNDHISDVNNTRNMIKALKKHNSNCLYTEYSKLGHWIPQKTYHNIKLHNWIFDQHN